MRRTSRVEDAFVVRGRLDTPRSIKLHVSGEGPYMNSIINKLERIQELSTCLRSDVESIDTDIHSIEQCLKVSCPISYGWLMPDDHRLIWDGYNIMITRPGEKGAKRLKESRWQLKVTYYHKLGEFLDKIIEEINKLVEGKQ